VPVITIGANTTDAYTGMQDTFVWEFGDNESTTDYLRGGALGTSYPSGIFLRATLPSVLTGATINSVSLQMVNTYGGNSGLVLNFFPCLRPWVLSEVTRVQYASGQNWSALFGYGAGTDYNATADYHAAYGTGTGSRTFTSSAMATRMQAWVDGTTPNNGYLMVMDSNLEGADDWVSSRGANGSRPRWVIDYTAASTGEVKELALTIAETQTQAAAVRRSRRLQSTVVETFGMTTAVRRTRRVATSIVEAETFVGGVRRARTVGTSITENESHSASLGRSRRIQGAIAESQAQATSLRRSRRIQADIAEAASMALTVGKLKAIGFSVAQNQAMTVSVGKLKALSLLVQETANVAVIPLRRSRGLALFDALVESMSVALVRERSMAASVTEAEAVSSMLRRLRTLETLVTETSGLSVTLTNISPEPEPGAELEFMTGFVEWQEWQRVGSEQRLVNRMETFITPIDRSFDVRMSEDALGGEAE
jgi:hypothetical protein